MRRWHHYRTRRSFSFTKEFAVNCFWLRKHQLPTRIYIYISSYIYHAMNDLAPVTYLSKGRFSMLWLCYILVADCQQVHLQVVQSLWVSFQRHIKFILLKYSLSPAFAHCITSPMTDHIGRFSFKHSSRYLFRFEPSWRQWILVCNSSLTCFLRMTSEIDICT